MKKPSLEFVSRSQSVKTAATALATGMVVILVSIMATGCGGSEGNAHGNSGDPRGQAQTEEAIAVKVAAMSRQTISSLYSTSATLRADRHATVIARTRGVVERLLVEEGDTVEAGQALAELERDEQRIAAARARTLRDTTKRDLERLHGLLEQGMVSEDEFERSRREAEDAEHALELAELELSRTVIRAPFAGVVLRRHLDVGATVSDGTAVYDLADLDPLYADINIPERHVIRLGVGQRVNLTADATHETVAARIERIAPLVDTATGTVKVTVAVEGSAVLRPGAFVRVDIVTDTHDDALVVPRSALVAEGRRWFLYRLADGEADEVQQIEVAVGFENGDRVEVAGVVSDGVAIDAGEQVVVVGAPALSDGAVVRVIRNSVGDGVGDGEDGGGSGQEAAASTTAVGA